MNTAPCDCPPGQEPGLLDPETSALTMRPPRLPQLISSWFHFRGSNTSTRRRRERRGDCHIWGHIWVEWHHWEKIVNWEQGLTIRKLGWVYSIRTDHGKPEKSWNLIILFSRGPLLQGPENVSQLESHGKISKLISLKNTALIFLEIFVIECCTVSVRPPMTSSLSTFA